MQVAEGRKHLVSIEGGAINHINDFGGYTRPTHGTVAMGTVICRNSHEDAFAESVVCLLILGLDE